MAAIIGSGRWALQQRCTCAMRMIAPWVIAAIIGVAFVLVGELPFLRIVGAQRMIVLPPLSSVLLPVLQRQESRDAVLTVALSYWVVGGLCALRSWRRVPTGKAGLSQHMLLLAVAVLCFAPAMLSVVWMLAAKMGTIPWAVAGDAYGPWQQIEDLRRLLQVTRTLPWISVALAGLSFGLRPSKAAVSLSATAIAAALILYWSHHWLIG